MSTTIKKLTNLPTSPYREWYNNWVSLYARGSVLDVGKSSHWDYGFPTIDINRNLRPTYVGNIERTNFTDNQFDIVLCNGLFEFVDDPQAMIDEVIRIAKKQALFGFVGRNYKPYKRPWRYFLYDDSLEFPTGAMIAKNFGEEYHFILWISPL